MPAWLPKHLLEYSLGGLQAAGVMPGARKFLRVHLILIFLKVSYLVPRHVQADMCNDMLSAGAGREGGRWHGKNDLPQGLRRDPGSPHPGPSRSRPHPRSLQRCRHQPESPGQSLLLQLYDVCSQQTFLSCARLSGNVVGLKDTSSLKCNNLWTHLQKAWLHCTCSDWDC